MMKTGIEEVYAGIAQDIETGEFITLYRYRGYVDTQDGRYVTKNFETKVQARNAGRLLARKMQKMQS